MEIEQQCQNERINIPIIHQENWNKLQQNSKQAQQQALISEMENVKLKLRTKSKKIRKRSGESKALVGQIGSNKNDKNGSHKNDGNGTVVKDDSTAMTNRSMVQSSVELLTHIKKLVCKQITEAFRQKKYLKFNKKFKPKSILTDNQEFHSLSGRQENVNFHQSVIDEENSILGCGVTRNKKFMDQCGATLEKRLMRDQIDYQQCLRLNHSAEGKLNGYRRAKMVNWMVEVLQVFASKTTNNTYFKSVQLLDRYIMLFEDGFPDAELHVTGCVCMFIASKYEEKYVISLNNMLEHACHSKFTEQYFKQKEGEVIYALEFDICHPTSYDFMQYFYYKLFLDEEDDPNLIQLKHNTQYILKICQLDSTFSQFPPSIMALSAIYYAIDVYNVQTEACQRQISTSSNDKKQILLNSVLKLKMNGNELNQINIRCCLLEIQRMLTEFQAKWAPEFQSLAKNQDFVY